MDSIPTNPPSDPQPTHGIERSRPTFLVLAGNMREFTAWQYAKSIPRGQALFVSNTQVLLGNRWDDARIIIIGTFHLRPDSNEILDHLRLLIGEGKIEYQSF